MRKLMFVFAGLVVFVGLGASAQEAEIKLADLFAAPTTAVETTNFGEVLDVKVIFDEEHPEWVRGETVQYASGCTATANCFHGGSVTCSSPTGTCTVSYAQCGWVQCGNDPAVRCPGSCVHDWHCFTFCGGDEQAFCAFDKCCECS